MLGMRYYAEFKIIDKYTSDKWQSDQHNYALTTLKRTSPDEYVYLIAAKQRISNSISAEPSSIRRPLYAAANGKIDR